MLPLPWNVANPMAPCPRDSTQAMTFTEVRSLQAAIHS